MASNLGALTVSLGLDAAQYTSGLTKAERDAYAFGESIGKGIRDAATLAATALATLGVSAGGALAGFNSLIEGASKFAELADKTGASAEGLASFAIAAGTSGTSMDKIAAGMNTLTKNLVGVGDESKAAGAALTALGVPIKDFKALSPEQQIETVSRSLAGFKDGADKSAVAMALLGRSGADLLGFLKTLEEQNGRQKILTQEQIELADEFADRQAKAKAELELYAQALSTQAVPAISAFTGALTDTIKEMLGVDSVTKELKNSTAIQEFAERSVRVLAFIVDAAEGVVRIFQVVGKSIGAAAAAAAAAGSGDFAIAKEIAKQGAADVDAILNRELFSSKLEKRIAEGKAALKAVKAPDVRRDLQYGGATKRASKGRDTAAQEAKAQLAADLDSIKLAQEALTNSYANQDKILSALRSAGLQDDGQYYAEKKRLLDLNTRAQEIGLQKTLERLQQEKVAGKDAIDNQKKIADAQAKLSKLREDSTTQATIYGIEEAAAFKRVESAILSARQAAADFFETTNRGYERALEGIGKGTKARDLASGITQIEDKYREQRQQLQNQKAQAELMGSFGPDAQRQFDAQLGIINDFQSKAIESYRAYYASLDSASKSWTNGATEALKNYADAAADVSKQMEQVVGSAFKGLEDQLVDFVTTGKADFKSLIDSILKDVARLVIKQQITGPLAAMLNGQLGGGTDELGAFLKSSGLSGGNSGGGWLSSLLSMWGGGRAQGGEVSPGKLYRVNENRPEVLDVNGKQFLMMGNQRGTVDPNPRFGGGGGGMRPIINNFTVQGSVDRSTQQQIAKRAGDAIRIASARQG